MELERLVRVGTVTSVDPGRLKARVSFKDENMDSGWLSVLQHDNAALRLTPDGYGPHTHPGSVLGTWMPKVNDTVLTVFIPVYQGDGYILGRIEQ